MKLLLDENLSRHLVGRLRDVFPQTEHVTAVGLREASDREVWEYARDHDHVIVSKDSDFRQLAFLHGPPPKVVWVRLGNASTTSVLQVILDYLPDIEAFAEASDEALLVLPAPPLAE